MNCGPRFLFVIPPRSWDFFHPQHTSNSTIEGGEVSHLPTAFHGRPYWLAAHSMILRLACSGLKHTGTAQKSFGTRFFST